MQRRADRHPRGVAHVVLVVMAGMLRRVVRGHISGCRLVSDASGCPGRVQGRLVELVGNAPGDQLAGDTRFVRRLRLDNFGHYRLHAAAIRAHEAWSEKFTLARYEREVLEVISLTQTRSATGRSI